MIKRSRISLNRIIYPKLKLEDFFKFTKNLDLEVEVIESRHLNGYLYKKR